MYGVIVVIFMGRGGAMRWGEVLVLYVVGAGASYKG